MKDNQMKQELEKIRLDEEKDTQILDGILKYKDNKANMKSRTAYSKFAPVAAASVALIVCGGVTVYATEGFGGKLSFWKANPTSEMKTAYGFTFDDSIKIDADEITGQVNECSAIIKKQCENIDFFSSQSEYTVDKDFSSAEEAVQYIGYEPLSLPQLDGEPSNAHLFVIGNEEGDLLQIQLWQTFEISEYVDADSSAFMYTEDDLEEIVIGSVSCSNDFEGVDYSAETQVQNGREFYVVSSTEWANSRVGKEVYWQEDKVVYKLLVRYYEEEEEKADEIIDKWMNQF